MISARLGHMLDKPLGPIARRIPVSPNVLTVAGFLITVGAAFCIPVDLPLGGVLILAGGFFDMLDGAVARASGRNTRFGALLDSTLDRYSDAFLFIGVAWHFFALHDLTGMVVTIGGLVGSVLISYVRARAEGLGIACHVGLIERPERIVLMAAGCLTGWIFPAMAVLFVLSHLTVIQRILHVRRLLKEEGPGS